MIVLSDYFLFSWNNRFLGEKDYSLNFRRVLRVIFSPSEIQAKMIISCHSSSVIVLFPFNFPITTDFLMAWYVQNNRSLSTELSREGGGGVDTTTASRTPLFLCLPTDKTLTQSTHVYMCDAISFMTYDVSDLERFPISPEVMLCRFFILSTNFRFLTFLACENVKWTLLGSLL